MSIEAIGERARQHFLLKHEARENALRLSRRSIQYSSQSIQAVHRGELDSAVKLLSASQGVIKEASASLQPHPDIYYAGFLADAQKEYAEAAITLALISGRPLPTPESLAVSYAPYLNGMAEAIGELRRHLLDRLRRGLLDGYEDLLRHMDDIYGVLVTMDFPDAITQGLRHNVDRMRAVLERTRADTTMAAVEARLTSRLAMLEQIMEQVAGRNRPGARAAVPQPRRKGSARGRAVREADRRG